MNVNGIHQNLIFVHDVYKITCIIFYIMLKFVHIYYVLYNIEASVLADYQPDKTQLL